MNWSNLPPLTSLRAFAAFAQVRSVSKAGQALNVSHAAVSQQIRALETYLNVALIDRTARKLDLTPEGRRLSDALLISFGAMHEAIAELRQTEEDRPLTITCTPSFAAAWLMPRLPRFRAKHPDVSMMIDPNPALRDPGPQGVDIALRYGHGPWPGLDAKRLMRTQLVVVGATSLFPDGPPEDLRTLAHLPWFNELGTSETSHWLAEQGHSTGGAVSVVDVPGNLVLDGVRREQGLAVVTRLSVEQDIASGLLMVLSEVDTGAGYHAVTRPGLMRPALKAFCRWLLTEVRKT